ncbi:MAG: outer membrane protein assembly factor BamA, partial [Bacteroidales bacterium]|nr:outer membrane protein assembly factor BamA [Bacteroidales bacterium]
MRRLVLIVVLALVGITLRAQSSVEIDYAHPRKYTVGGVGVEGNQYFSENQILQLSGLREGMEITVPGDEVTGIVRRLVAQKYFEDVAVRIDSVKADSAWVNVVIRERPRVSRWTYTGVKSGEKKDLQERLNLRPGREFSDYVRNTSTDIIKRYYKEKGFNNVKVDTEVTKDSVIRSAIRVNFIVDRGKKIHIKKINFTGNTDVKERKLAKNMKETHAATWYNFFKSKKFKEKEYQTDRKTVLDAFNEAGYRDARLVRDSVYLIDDKHINIDMDFDQGKKYYFRNITWTGNSVYPSEVLNNILQIKKGDVYDVVTMEKRLHGGGKENEYDVSKMYKDNGFLFFNVTPVEVNIQNDSIDVEMRISEGKPATLNEVIINGNDLTNERVVRRQLMTRPGYLFSQSDFERSIREIASMGQFDAEAIMQYGTGYNIIPNQLNNTVDVIYNVTEKPSSQLELSGGWGGNTFVLT